VLIVVLIVVNDRHHINVFIICVARFYCRLRFFLLQGKC